VASPGPHLLIPDSHRCSPVRTIAYLAVRGRRHGYDAMEPLDLRKRRGDASVPESRMHQVLECLKTWTDSAVTSSEARLKESLAKRQAWRDAYREACLEEVDDRERGRIIVNLQRAGALVRQEEAIHRKVTNFQAKLTRVLA
jgi:hypothetical protein